MYKILVTNDDGFDADGLKLLVKALKELDNVDIYVVAPSSEKSACGHSLTLKSALKFVEISKNYYKLEDATPSDCVYLSLSTMFKESKPDLLISGINRGSNMGEDITYSGTVAGAMEGVLHNIPSIAISQVVDFKEPTCSYDLACKTIKEIVTKIRTGAFPLPHRELLNINIPLHVESSSLEVTYASYRHYDNDSQEHINPRGEKYYWLGLHQLKASPRNNGATCRSDFEAIEDSKISITPIMLDLSAYKSIDNLKEWISKS